VKWARRVRKALPEAWEERVLWVLLVLPVSLVLLVVLVSLAPKARQVLLEWLQP
jgi:hypothetical protein